MVCSLLTRRRRKIRLDDIVSTGTANVSHDQKPESSPLAFQPEELASIFRSVNLQGLDALGGTEKLLKGLCTRPSLGIVTVQKSQSDKAPAGGLFVPLEERRRIYGHNVEQTSQIGLGSIMVSTWKGSVPMLCLFAFSIIIPILTWVLSCYVDERYSDDWIVGPVLGISAIFTVVILSFVEQDVEKHIALAPGPKGKTRVIRDGKEKLVNPEELVVGDIAFLEAGDVLPCDGIFLGGHGVKCDESNVTGGVEIVQKTTLQKCLSIHKGSTPKSPAAVSCFLLSGSRVMEGLGRYVVVAVGPFRFSSTSARYQRRVELESEITNFCNNALVYGVSPSIVALDLVLNYIHGSQGFIGGLLAFARGIVTILNLLVFIFPDGLLLADRLVGALLIRDMNRHQLLVRSPKICRVMERISVLCLDKNGTITPDVTTVVAGSFGVFTNFVHRPKENEGLVKAHSVSIKKYRGSAIDFDRIATTITQDLRALIKDIIVITSTATECVDPVTEKIGFVGSKLEVALLQFCQTLGLHDTVPPDSHDIVEYIPFSSDKKASGAVVTVNGKYRLYVKGAADVLVKRCSRYTATTPNTPDLEGTSNSHGYLSKLFRHLARDSRKRTKSTNSDTSTVDEADISREINATSKEVIDHTLGVYDTNAFRAIALCYKDFDTWPPEGINQDENNEIPFEVLTRDLVMVAILGLEDPLRDGVADRVLRFQEAGITIKLCTGDGLGTARSAALRCGILSPDGMSVDGDAFRQLDDSQYSNIQVLAKCSPDDKRVFVEGLQAKGETVALIGDGINDVAALTAAHVGFSMGVYGTDAANNASDVVLMSEDLLPIYKAIIWSRHVCKGLRELLKFYLITSLTFILLSAITQFITPTARPILPPRLTIGIKVITNVIAPLALLVYQPPSSYPLETPAAGGLLFPLSTIRHILIQGCCQSLVLLLFHYRVLTLGYAFWSSPSGARQAIIAVVFTLMHFSNLTIRIWRYIAFLSQGARNKILFIMFITYGIVWQRTFSIVVFPQIRFLLDLELAVDMALGGFIFTIAYMSDYIS